MSTQDQIDAGHDALRFLIRQLPRNANIAYYRIKITTVALTRDGYTSNGSYRGIGAPLFTATITAVEPSGASHTQASDEFRAPKYQTARRWAGALSQPQDKVLR